MKANRISITILAFVSTLLNPFTVLAQDIPGISLTPSADYAISSQEWMGKYASRSVDKIGNFNQEKQLYIYETIQYKSHALWASANFKILKELKSKLGSPGTILNLIDKNNDGKPDEWVHHLPGRDSQDFGFMFDLNNDGKMDYFVFNGGPQFVTTRSRNFATILSGLYWMNYHWIDSNYDGKIDIVVFNDIDLNGDGNPDKGVTAWIYDDDFDGQIDRAEYLGYTSWFPMNSQYGKLWQPKKNQILRKPIEAKDGSFILQRSLNSRVLNKTFDIRNTELMSEIHSAVSSN